MAYFYSTKIKLMKKIFFIPLVLLLCYSFSMKSQSSLGIDSSFLSYSYVSPTSYNNVDLYTVTIYNFGPQIFTGNYQVIYAIDSAGIGNLNWVDSNTVSAATIAVNTGLADSAFIPISQTAYRSGINTVVIWPRMTSTPFTPVDTLKVQVLVMGFAGVTKNEVIINQKLFPNPIQQQLFIVNNDKNFVIEQVRIFDISGKLVYSEIYKGTIDVSKLISGTYTLEFADKAGKTTRYKVIKE